MTWNYRVVRHPDGTLSIHEAYYAAPYHRTPRSISKDPVRFWGADREELAEALRLAAKALAAPALNWEDF